MSAPERIWINGLGCYGTEPNGHTEYVRADLLATRERELAEARAARERAAMIAADEANRAEDAEAKLEKLEKENEALRAAMEDAEDTLQLVEQPAFLDPVHGDEIDRLGRRIGFGALMSSASASWRAYLLASGYPTGGEFVAGPCLGTVVSTLAKIRAALTPTPERNDE